MIIRTRATQRFTLLRNSILEDPNLSFKAKGLLSYLLSRPNNWRCNLQHLQTIGRDGRDSLRTAMREIRDAGYAKLVSRKHKVTGKFAGKEWTISDVKTERRVSRPS